MKEPKRVGIAGMGSYVPEKVLTNFDLEKMVDTTDEWIIQRTGIRERRIAADGEITSDLAVKASLKAIEDAGITAEDLDLIILGTVSGDNILPSTACHVQAKLNATNAAAFDISAACSGFIYGLSTGWEFMKSGDYKNCLVIGVEKLSTLVNWQDRSSCILFGDGAGAAILQETEKDKREIVYRFIKADGTGREYMIARAGLTEMPTTHETVEQKQHLIKIKGREVYKFAVTRFYELVKDAAEKCDYKPEEIGVIIPHQVNMRIIESALKRLDLPLEKVFLNIEKYGNTSAASVPIALDEAYRTGAIKKGDFVVMCAFGAGLTWGSVAVKW